VQLLKRQANHVGDAMWWRVSRACISDWSASGRQSNPQQQQQQPGERRGSILIPTAIANAAPLPASLASLRIVVMHLRNAHSARHGMPAWWTIISCFSSVISFFLYFNDS